MVPKFFATFLVVGAVCSRAFGNPLNPEERWWQGPSTQWGEAVGSAAVDSIPELIAPGPHIPRLIILIRIYGCRHYPDDSYPDEENSTADGIITEAPTTEVIRRDSQDNGNSGRDPARGNERTFRPPRYMPKTDKDREITPKTYPRY